MTAEPPPRLHAAMRRHGDVTLLQVRWHDATPQRKRSRSAAPGLPLGYIDRFGKRPPSSWDMPMTVGGDLPGCLFNNRD
jgi:hypothetical protein